MWGGHSSPPLLILLEVEKEKVWKKLVDGVVRTYSLGWAALFFAWATEPCALGAGEFDFALALLEAFFAAAAAFSCAIFFLLKSLTIRAT